MLGYADALCAVTNARFGQAASNVSILMNNLQCRGTEQALDQCDFGGWLNNDCTHREDAGVVCDDRKLCKEKSSSLIRAPKAECLKRQ